MKRVWGWATKKKGKKKEGALSLPNPPKMLHGTVLTCLNLSERVRELGTKKPAGEDETGMRSVQFKRFSFPPTLLFIFWFLGKSK